MQIIFPFILEIRTNFRFHFLQHTSCCARVFSFIFNYSNSIFVARWRTNKEKRKQDEGEKKKVPLNEVSACLGGFLLCIFILSNGFYFVRSVRQDVTASNKQS